MYIPHPWLQQYFPSYPPNLPPPGHGPPHYPPQFVQQQQTSPVSFPQESSLSQLNPAQQAWFAQQPSSSGPGYSPYVGLPAGLASARSHQAWPASDTRTQVDPVRSSYPPASGLSPVAGQQRGQGGSPCGAGTKRQAGGAPLEAQYSYPTFTPINPQGLSQTPPAPAPAKKAKADKPQKAEYYDVPALGSATPFITKLKFMVDNPSEFGEAVQWE